MTITAVRIWCTDWCTLPEQTHINDLESWEGRVVHSSGDFGVVRGEDYTLTMIGLPDGTPGPEETGHAEVMCIAGDGDLVHPDDMERHAQAPAGDGRSRPGLADGASAMTGQVCCAYEERLNAMLMNTKPSTVKATPDTLRLAAIGSPKPTMMKAIPMKKDGLLMSSRRVWSVLMAWPSWSRSSVDAIGPNPRLRPHPGPRPDNH